MTRSLIYKPRTLRIFQTNIFILCNVYPGDSSVSLFNAKISSNILHSMLREIASNLPGLQCSSLANDPSHRFDCWAPDLGIVKIKNVYSIPLMPVSHPFVENLIETLSRGGQLTE